MYLYTYMYESHVAYCLQNVKTEKNSKQEQMTEFAFKSTENSFK